MTKREHIGGVLLINHLEHIIKTSEKKAIKWSFSRSGGPGGQNVNKNDTKVHLSFKVEDSAFSDMDKEKIVNFYGKPHISITSEKHKSQLQNKNDALSRLLNITIESLRPRKYRKKTRVSFGKKQERLRDKKHHSNKKERRKINKKEYGL